MNYIALNNDTYVLRFNGKTVRISKKQTIGFSKIVQLLKEGGREEEIAELLAEKPSKLPVQLYLNTTTNDMTAVLIGSDNYLEYVFLKTGKQYRPSTGFEDNPDIEFIGLYKSLNDVKEEWPEYCL